MSISFRVVLVVWSVPRRGVELPAYGLLAVIHLERDCLLHPTQYDALPPAHIQTIRIHFLSRRSPDQLQVIGLCSHHMSSLHSFSTCTLLFSRVQPVPSNAKHQISTLQVIPSYSCSVQVLFRPQTPMTREVDSLALAPAPRVSLTITSVQALYMLTC